MHALMNEVSAVPEIAYRGRVLSVQGLLVEVCGPVHAMSIGSRLTILVSGGRETQCEVVGFRDDRVLCMPFGPLDGVRMGCEVVLGVDQSIVHPTSAWLGRVINAMGEPIDGKGPLPKGFVGYNLRETPPSAHKRSRVGGPVDLGVRALNTFITCCKGQRMGIFAGSGVGKSVLMSMLARNTACDVSIIGLIGERGREVQEFIQDDLGIEGLKRSVVIVATSDETALMRRQAAYLTLTMAEYFRDMDKDVLCLMDSVTRFATAQREIGLAGGEPPASKGYTPTVFSELPKLLERAGPGVGVGSITGLFTVLVEGDDHNEPVADAVRSILDGHIVMERGIAERGRYPAINVLKSVSRTMPDCVLPDALPVVTRARQLLATYSDMEELIRIGAYRPGADAQIDEAIHYQALLEEFLNQTKQDLTSIEDGYAQLSSLLTPVEPQSDTEETQGIPS